MGEGADNLSTSLTPRMRQLRQMLERQPDDPFLLYGLAMEHKKADEPGQARRIFRPGPAQDPNYCYAYYQRRRSTSRWATSTLPRRTLREGIEAAERSGDDHAPVGDRGGTGLARISPEAPGMPLEEIVELPEEPRVAPPAPLAEGHLAHDVTAWA